MHELKIINSMEVYIVQSHHHVLLPWSLVRRRLNTPPILITLDHHADTSRAFRNNIFHQLAKHPQDIPDIDDDYPYMSGQLLSQINFNNDAAVNVAIQKLCHDEHIDAALKVGIIDLAAAINLNSSSNAIIKDRIIEVSSGCYLGCPKTYHDDNCETKHASQVLESEYLDDMLIKVNILASSLGVSNVEGLPYILDIDLDYLHSEDSVQPKNTNTFFRLIRGAQAITIATEPECVEDLKIDNSQITADYLLEHLLSLIEEALG